MRSAIVRIDESRVEVELIDLVKFRPEALGWHFRYPQVVESNPTDTDTDEQKRNPVPCCPCCGTVLTLVPIEKSVFLSFHTLTEIQC